MLDTLTEMAVHALHERQATGGARIVYDHTENQGPKHYKTTSALFAVALFLVLVRGYVRAIMTKTLGMDDWVMFVSMVCTSRHSSSLS